LKKSWELHSKRCPAIFEPITNPKPGQFLKVFRNRFPPGIATEILAREALFRLCIYRIGNRSAVNTDGCG
jgi:hypothetical protein